MPGTFTSEIAREGLPWWAYVDIAGWGRRHNATSADRRNAYRWSTEHPADGGYTDANADAFVAALQTVPDASLPEAVEFREGGTALGQLVVNLVDGPIRTLDAAASWSHGWRSDVLTDLLGIEAADGDGPWSLASDVTAAATTWTLDGVTGIAVGDVIHIGAEAVVVTALPGGNQITVVRAQLGTTARAHDTFANGGEGRLYDRPRFVRGRAVRLYVNLYDGRTGLPLANDQARLIRTYTLDDWDQVDENTFQLVCKPALGLLDRAVGRDQFNATALVTVDEHAHMAADEEATVSVQVPDGVGMPPYPQYTYSGAAGDRKIDFYARLGDQLVDVDYHQRDGEAVNAVYRLQSYGLLGTPLPTGEASEDQQLPFRDVLPVHPHPHRDPSLTPLRFFEIGGTPTQHPIDIALALATSTGDGTNGDHDILPENWGAGVPAARFNTASFLQLRHRYPFLRFRSLVIGWDGAPSNLRRWIEAVLFGPLGWFFYLDHNGLIAVGAVEDVYDVTTLPTITEADWAERPPPQLTGQLGETTTLHTFRYGWDLARGEYKATSRYRHAQTAERYGGDDSELVLDLPGLEAGPAGDAILRARSVAFARWWETPLPRLRGSVGLHRLELDVTASVAISCSTLPNPFTGTRGMTTVPAVVASAAPNLANGTLDLELILLPTPNNGLWAAAARVASYDGGTLTVTCDASVVTDGEAVDNVPATDAPGFVTGDRLMLIDSNLRVRSNNTDTAVASQSGNDVVLDNAFSIAPVAGNWITYLHWASGAAPAGTWTSRMQLHVAAADDADEQLPDAAAGYVYGA